MIGTHKATQYVAGNHRLQIRNTWISKASATQRAGRTGRLRPGRVFRLYSDQIYEKLVNRLMNLEPFHLRMYHRFQAHEASEILRMPLQEVILNLRITFESARDFEGMLAVRVNSSQMRIHIYLRRSGVEPLLADLLEPPEMANVNSSFDYLFDAGMITSNSDRGNNCDSLPLSSLISIFYNNFLISNHRRPDDIGKVRRGTVSGPAVESSDLLCHLSGVRRRSLRYGGCSFTVQVAISSGFSIYSH